MSIRDQWVKTPTGQGSYDQPTPKTLRDMENVKVSRGVLTLLDDLDMRINALYEIINVLEQNLSPVLRPPANVDVVKSMDDTGDSLLGTKLCNANYQLELLQENIMTLSMRINL